MLASSKPEYLGRERLPAQNMRGAMVVFICNKKSRKAGTINVPTAV
ncbi:hypothetical protein AC84_4971 [Escherichia coli 1-392-07_S4_C1]|nr:hypothetical protein AD31_4742 [Escherichia coli 2-427-07_S4_C3]KEN94982.1 hypothetical protein AC84_4971 [Escherichia coli 1-392-07_S4_C1]CDK48629.1 hypothetical protein [Escherichia coli IS1]